MKGESGTISTPGPRWPEAAVVFYDGSCPLCSREIAHYRRLRGAERLRWVDVARDSQTLAFFGVERDALMARFHVLDRKGHWQTGAWGFAELWSHIPAYRWLAFTLRKLSLLGLIDKAYSKFAAWRLRRQCSDNACTPGL